MESPEAPPNGPREAPPERLDSGLTEDEMRDLVAIASAGSEQEAVMVLAALAEIGLPATTQSEYSPFLGSHSIRKRLCVPRKLAERARQVVREIRPELLPEATTRDRVASRVAEYIVYFNLARQIAYALLGGGLALLILGGIFLSKGITEERYQSFPTRLIDLTGMQPACVAGDNGNWRVVHAVCGPAWMFGTAMLAAGALILSKRFALRWLIGGALVAGFAGTIPFVLIPWRVSGAHIEVRLNATFSSAATNRMLEKLRWDAARKTFPAEMVQELGEDRFGNGVEAWNSTWKISDRVTGAGSSLDFRVFVGRETCLTVVDFYSEYLARLTQEASGLPVREVPMPASSVLWARWRGKWLQSQPPP